MPKGVEHLLVEQSRRLNYAVRPSLMPKGVEHMFAATRNAVATDCATLFDAERR